MMMKNVFSVKRLGVTMSALLAMSLGVTLTSCDRDKPSPDPEPKKEGVEALIDYENVRTGETTRVVTGENGYDFSLYGQGGVVQMDGGGFHEKQGTNNNIVVRPSFYGEQNIVFHGWSWRYSDDAKGTHRNSDGNKQTDYVALPALQLVNGLKPLPGGSQQFTCQFRPGTDNKVYVKVSYEKVNAEQIVELDPLTGASGMKASSAKYGELLQVLGTTQMINTFTTYFSSGDNIPGEVQHPYETITKIKWGSLDQLINYLSPLPDLTGTIGDDTSIVLSEIDAYQGDYIEIDGTAATGNSYDNFITKHVARQWVWEFQSLINSERLIVENYISNLKSKKNSLPQGDNVYYWIRQQ